MQRAWRWLVLAAVVASSCGAPAPQPDGGRGDGGAVDAGAGGGPDGGAADGGARDGGAGDAGVDGGAADDGGTQVPDAGPCTALSGVVTSVARGTYCVTGDVIIPTGVTLTVPPGTTFIFQGRYHFGRDPSIPDLEPPDIPGSGSLHAIGTAAEPIVFRGETLDTGWYGILIAHTHDTVHLEYVTIRDTLKDDDDPSSRAWRWGGALNSYVNAKGTLIRHCTFINNVASAVGGAVNLNSHGDWPNRGRVEITDSLFEGNRCDCFAYPDGPDDLCGGGALRVSHIGGDASLVTIERNVFRGNEARKASLYDAYGGAIGGFDSSIIVGPGNAFLGNRASTGDGAVSCAHHPQTGVIISSIDSSVTFSGNVPDNGCGR